MRRYAGTLRAWREGGARPLPMLLEVYAQAVAAVELLQVWREV